MDLDEAVLDHDHETGHIRSALHRQCNQVEGRVLGWAGRTGHGTPEKILKSILSYWSKDWTCNPLHPKHLTEEEKQIRALKKRRKKVKRASTKAKYDALIKELENQNG